MSAMNYNKMAEYLTQCHTESVVMSRDHKGNLLSSFRVADSEGAFSEGEEVACQAWQSGRGYPRGARGRSRGDLEVLPVVARLHEGRWTMVGTRSPLVPGEAVHLLHPTMEPQCMEHSVATGGLLHFVDGVIGPGDSPVVPSDRQMSNRTDKKSMTVPT